MTINCNGELLDLSSPKVMGILNITPDSFHDGGENTSKDQWKRKIDQFIEEGVDIIDIGGQSTRPNAQIIEASEELNRIIPVIEFLNNNYQNQLISVDTFRSEVAKAAINSGAHIINDVSGGNMDDKMFEAVAELQVPYVLMHMRGTPDTMQDNLIYENIFMNIFNYFTRKIDQLTTMGVNDIIIDLGFGFSKSLEDNYYLLNRIPEFHHLNLPILVGVSRKSMIHKALNISAQEALTGTIALNAIALRNGANILRVHDIKEAKQTIRMIELIKENN